ncbi:hypothetical protein [Klebsiella pneumoniae]|uniref:hypothetical protein n=1 Tax=Klebsiella pneumoniae TaxID=573 RepID=UPI0021CFC337|nr:hypothetical protein [Klebsiella pneumoniae]MCU6588138.1 hypothetical protein [Klebsiella pneumoniae]
MEDKETLLTPKTEYPMSGNLPNNAPEWQAKCAEVKLYVKFEEQNAAFPIYMLHA